VDTVAPEVAVTGWVGTLPSLEPTRVLSGTVSDGSGASQVYINVTAPEGEVSSYQAARDGDAWSFTLNPETAGFHSLEVEAWDAKRNTSTLGPFPVFVEGAPSMVYLPLVTRGY
jgi:hypothetical protein